MDFNNLFNKMGNQQSIPIHINNVNVLKYFYKFTDTPFKTRTLIILLLGVGWISGSHEENKVK